MSNTDCGNAVVMITGIVITGVGFGFLFNILKSNIWCYRRCLERRGKDPLGRNGENNNVDYQFGWSEKIIDRKHYAERIKQLRHR